MLSRLSIKWVALLWLAALALLISPVAAQTTTEPSFPLAEEGPYVVGFQRLLFTDANRDGRNINSYILYPAIAPENPTKIQQNRSKFMGWVDATPDTSASPYPLIMMTPGLTQDFTSLKSLAMTLVSHGFVVVGLQHPGEESPLSFVNRPIDVLFALDQLTAINESRFSGVIDTNHVGVWGLSYGAYTALVLTGARIDPTLASAMTAAPSVSSDFSDSDPRHFFPDWNWDDINTYRAQFSPLESNELWPPFTDKRILAAVMFSPCWIRMFGESGLASATVPSLIFGGTKDDICPYNPDETDSFDQLGSKDHYLLTVIDGGHGGGFDDRSWPVAIQLYTAFFDEYLKGQQDDAQYLTKEWVDSVEAELKLGLVWGPYSEP